jgi:hypothetical protein
VKKPEKDDPVIFSCARGRRSLEETILTSEIYFLKLSLKGSRQPESRGVRNVSICPNMSRTAAIDVLFSIILLLSLILCISVSAPVKQTPYFLVADYL